MRLLVFALCLSALGAGSYAALTRGWASDAAEPARTEPADAHRQPDAPRPEPLAPATRGRPAVRTRVTVETYNVTGDTAGDVLVSMLAGGPQPGDDVFFGLTTAETHLRYDTTPVAGGCVLADVSVDLTLTIMLPAWSPTSPPDAQLVRDWGGFRRALADHEDRHRQIAEAGAQRLARALAGLRRDSCPATKAEARRRVQRIEADVSAAQRQYDAETGHGRTEGAVWPR